MKQWKERDYYAGEPTEGRGKPRLSQRSRVTLCELWGVHSLPGPPSSNSNPKHVRVPAQPIGCHSPGPWPRRGQDAPAGAPATLHRRRVPGRYSLPNPTRVSLPSPASLLIPQTFAPSAQGHTPHPSPGPPPVPGFHLSPRRWKCRSRERSWSKWWLVLSAVSETGTPWLAQDPAPPHRALGAERERRRVPESPRKLPKTYERLQPRKAGNTVQFSRG